MVVLSFGYEVTEPGKRVGPCVREKYVLLYVLEGKGTFNGMELKKGRGFIVCPHQKHSYVSDAEHPMVYCWVTFAGDGCEDFLQEIGLFKYNQIFSYCFSDRLTAFAIAMADYQPSVASVNEYLMGCLMLLRSFHLESRTESAATEIHTQQEQYVEIAAGYVRNNYHHTELLISDVASFVGIEKHYLSMLFSSKMGISPKEYLITTRIDKAKQLLADDTLSIQEVARSVGYVDPLYFSRIFKKYVGVSPQAFRKELS